MLRGGIAERGGVRVGHRIIEINNQSVVAVPHEKIVNLLATSVGEVRISFLISSFHLHKTSIPHFLNEILLHSPSLLDSHEDDANVNVPTFDWTGKSNLYLNN